MYFCWGVFARHFAIVHAIAIPRRILLVTQEFTPIQHIFVLSDVHFKVFGPFQGGIRAKMHADCVCFNVSFYMFNTVNVRIHSHNHLVRVSIDWLVQKG